MLKLSFTLLAILLASLYPHYRGETMAACVVFIWWVWFSMDGA